ncbi:MAG: hypothetical protein Q8R37_05255 [Nanoarchaeota archaeon]|nr:hypothetical protein [Nanoarchaeota archaeon]
MEPLSQVVNSIPSVYPAAEIKKYLIPLLGAIIRLHTKNKTIIIGIQGGQGTGKTTLSRFLQHALAKASYTVQSFSLDDFYKTNKERIVLRKKYPHNAFYQIPRGLPGTHRVQLLKETLRKIKSGTPFELPLFDKSLHHAQGDVLRKTINVTKRPDFVFFEGWCLGLPAVSSTVLQAVSQQYHLNLKNLDPTLQDHKVVLRYAKDYQPLWRFIDYWIMLKPSNTKLHTQWRYKQEQELKKRAGKGMTKTEINRFVEPYLPFTYLCYEKVKPDALFLINEHHCFSKVRYFR